MEWRLIIDGKKESFWNIALDKALLFCYYEVKKPTLRFYQWKIPTLSIGYFQKISPELSQRCQSKNIPIIKRPTGGKAVLHHNELTYSIVAPYYFFHPKKNILEIYSCIANIFLKAFLNMGIQAEVVSNEGPKKSNFFCFEEPSYCEIFYKGKKLMGSAQRYFKEILLQHGSIPLSRDLYLTKEIFGDAHIEKWTSLQEILGYIPDKNWIIFNIIEAFKTILNSEFKIEAPSALEIKSVGM